METYSEFLERINSFEKKQMCLGDKHFDCNPSMSHKVDKNNTFKSFYGDTVVFELDDSVKAKLAEYTNLLHGNTPQCFCERLVANTFHVTLHDLSNSTVLRDIGEDVFNNELKIIEKKSELQKHKNVKIKMKSNYIFNMVSTSLCLGLFPADDAEYQKLMELYYIFDDIKNLGYPLTPHITLSYYNINGFDTKSARILESTVNELNKNQFELELNINKLYYQKFTNMNNYIDIINIGTI